MAACLLIGTTLISDPAHAFRCKNKIVKDGMHEQQVLAICGSPASSRHLGYAIRGYSTLTNRSSIGGWVHGQQRTHPHLVQEVAITEYVYNFGPRKLMRRLVFEGALLVRIETLGYGYIEK